MLYIRMLYLIANNYRYMSFSLYYPAYHHIFSTYFIPVLFFVHQSVVFFHSVSNNIKQVRDNQNSTKNRTRMEEQQLDISINSNKRILTEAELGIKIKTKVQKVNSFYSILLSFDRIN